MFKDPKIALILFIVVLIFLILFSIRNTAHGLDRCQEFLPEIRNASMMYLGPTYPYWYNVGCAITETSCRSNLVSFDGGIGLFQFTPSTGVTAELKKYGMIINPRDVESSINGQAFYIKIIRDNKLQVEKILVGKGKNPAYPAKFTKICGKNLADYYRFYNGGYWFVYESGRKGKNLFACDNKEMRKYCVRGGTYTDKAKTKWLSFCDVNYSYPEKVYNYGRKYNNGLPDQEIFWFTEDEIQKQPKTTEPKKGKDSNIPEPSTEDKEKIKKEKPLPDKEKLPKLDPYYADLVMIMMRKIKPFAM